MSKGKVFLLNFAGVVVGIIAGAITSIIANFVFLDLIPKIPIIPQLLSWPSGYEWYAITGIITGTLGASLVVSNKLCSIAQSKINYGTVILAVIFIIDYIITMVSYFLENGFSFTPLVVYLYGIGFCIVFGLEFSSENSNNNKSISSEDICKNYYFYVFNLLKNSFEDCKQKTEVELPSKECVNDLAEEYFDCEILSLLRCYKLEREAEEEFFDEFFSFLGLTIKEKEETISRIKSKTMDFYDFYDHGMAYYFIKEYVSKCFNKYNISNISLQEKVYSIHLSELSAIINSEHSKKFLEFTSDLKKAKKRENKQNKYKKRDKLYVYYDNVATMIKYSHDNCYKKIEVVIKDQDLQSVLVCKYLDFLLLNVTLFFDKKFGESTAFNTIDSILLILGFSGNTKDTYITKLKNEYIDFLKYFYSEKTGEYIKDYTSEIIRDNDGNICAMTLLELVGIQIDDFTENFVPALKNLRI